MDMVSYDNIEIKESAYGIALMLANMYFDKNDPVRKKLQRDFMMKIDCIDEVIQESYEKGTNDGIGMIENLLKNKKITPEDAIEQLLSINCDIDVISKITGLPKKEIELIINKMTDD